MELIKMDRLLDHPKMPQISWLLFLVAAMLFFYAPTGTGGMAIFISGLGIGLTMFVIGKLLYRYDHNDI